MKRRHFLEFIQAIRQSFYQQNFLEIPAPPLVQNPGMEVHIHPFQVHSLYKLQAQPFFLNTSPEFWMKKILTEGQAEQIDQIFSLGYAFRDEPLSPLHRPQFLMLEWYRSSQPYETILHDTIHLIAHLNEHLKKQRKPCVLNTEKVKIITMEELWLKFVHFSPLEHLNQKKFLTHIQKNLPQVPLPHQPETLGWDDLFFLVFLNEIEPHLSQWPILFVTEFPAPLSALAELDTHNPKVAKRFELYIKGVEIANCYQELTDFSEQKQRFQQQQYEKQKLYHYQLPWPEKFLSTLEKGLPPSSGVALGIERLYALMTGSEQVFYFDE
jgi:lysyl-tRNA synthetase class 2